VELACTSIPLQVALRWQPVTDPCGIDRYEIELGEDDYDYAYEGPTTSMLQIDGGLSEAVISTRCGYDYTWRIRAVDDEDNASAWSWTAGFRVLSDNEAPPVPEPIGPGNTDSANPTSASPCSQVVLSWNPVSDVSSPVTYRVVLQRRMNGDWEDIEPYSTFSTTSVDVAQWISPGYYRWLVRATDDAGNASDSSSWLYFSCPIL
jgi:hypothetical protein